MADDIVTRCPECNEFGMRYMGRVANDGDGPWVKCHHLITPDEWAPPPPDGPHDHKGHSEERCVRCGWVMGMTALNCQNDDTPHRFPSQEAEIERLREERDTARAEASMKGYRLDDVRDEIERLRAAGDALVESLDHSRADIRSAVAAWEEARRG